MCLTLPARVVQVANDAALVELDGRTITASTLLEPETQAGDLVLVSAGTILRRLDPAEAEFVTETIRTAEARSVPEARSAADGPGSAA